MNAAHSMQLRKLEKKIGFHSNVRPVRVIANAAVWVLMTATSAQTPKMIAIRRQVVNGGAGEGGESTIRGVMSVCGLLRATGRPSLIGAGRRGAGGRPDFS